MYRAIGSIDVTQGFKWKMFGIEQNTSLCSNVKRVSNRAIGPSPIHWSVSISYTHLMLLLYFG